MGGRGDVEALKREKSLPMLNQDIFQQLTHSFTLLSFAKDKDKLVNRKGSGRPEHWLR